MKEWTWSVAVGSKGVHIIGNCWDRSIKPSAHVAWVRDIPYSTSKKLLFVVQKFYKKCKGKEFSKHLTRDWTLFIKGKNCYISPSHFKYDPKKVRVEEVPQPKLSLTRLKQLVKDMDKKVQIGEVEQTKKILRGLEGSLNRVFEK